MLPWGGEIHFCHEALSQIDHAELYGYKNRLLILT